MNENLERRKSVRIDHTSVLKVKNLKSGKIYKAKMFNYSENGLYFETNSVFDRGDHIYIGIQDSPYASLSGVLEYYRAQIMWSKKLKESYFEYGYGIQFHAACEKNSPKTNDLEKIKDIRKNQKKSSRKTIKVSDQNRTYDGLIKDISSSGIFFEADDTFEEGQILTFAVTLKNGKNANIIGQIVWADDEGFGVIFMHNS